MEKLLFEIGTEEIPAKFMPGILTQLKELVAKKMEELRIPFSEIKVYGTPRRMTFIVAGIPETQETSEVEAKGPALNIAYVNGEPSKAAIGFARGQGVDVKDLEVRGEYVYAVKKLEGQPIENLLPGLLEEIIHSLTFPKTMRWGSHEFRFVRPIRWMVALFGDKLVPVEITGVKSGKYSRGHRYLTHSIKDAAAEKRLITATLEKVGNKVHSLAAGMKGSIEIPSANDYEKVLGDNFVLVDQDARREIIKNQIMELAKSENGIAEIDDDLLEEVIYLVEYPTALCGNFEEKFLSLPKEAIITPMKEHQRYFPVLDDKGNLLNKFITGCNGGSEHIDTIAHGNERVLRARLSDAEFFFNEDRKVKLEDRLEKLKTVVFQEGLGNIYDKSERLVGIVEMLQYGLNLKLDKDALKRAALLSKTDLVTGMVCEFTELQGTMGREYALLDGEKPEVAEGIYEHYLPRFAGDELPKGHIGRLVGVADKLDNIVATFSRGLAPTGSQDPYALRRQALGIIHILIDGKYHLSMMKLLGGVMSLLKVPNEKIKEVLFPVMDFFKLRLRNLLLEQGIRYDVIDAVYAEEKNDDIYDLYLRIIALNEFVSNNKDAEVIIQAATRVNNLCKKNEKEIPVNENLFKEVAEKELYKVVLEIDKEIIPATVKYNYEEVLKISGKLVEPVNKFFEEVMVMDNDEQIKDNRLALLEQVKGITNAVGDFSNIVS